MGYDQPDNWHEVAAVFDPKAAHQIRLIQSGNTNVLLSCACKMTIQEHNPNYRPIGVFDTTDGPEPIIEAYWGHLADESRT